MKIWDIDEDRNDEAIITFTDIPDYATSIRWSPDGKMIAGMVKNKSMVILIPDKNHLSSRQLLILVLDNSVANGSMSQR